MLSVYLLIRSRPCLFHAAIVNQKAVHSCTYLLGEEEVAMGLEKDTSTKMYMLQEISVIRDFT